MMSGDVSAVDELACPSFRVQQTTQDREAPAEFQPKLRGGGAAAGFDDSEENCMPGVELEPDVEELSREGADSPPASAFLVCETPPEGSPDGNAGASTFTPPLACVRRAGFDDPEGDFIEDVEETNIGGAFDEPPEEEYNCVNLVLLRKQLSAHAEEPWMILRDIHQSGLMVR